MDLLWVPVGDAYTLGPAHQEVKQTGIFPQHVFLVAVTEDFFYFSKHRVRPSSLDFISIFSTLTAAAMPEPSRRSVAIRSHFSGKRGRIESGRSLFVLSENLNQLEKFLVLPRHEP